MNEHNEHVEYDDNRCEWCGKRLRYGLCETCDQP